jgi:hypothetical protein
MIAKKDLESNESLDKYQRMAEIEKKNIESMLQRAGSLPDVSQIRSREKLFESLSDKMEHIIDPSMKFEEEFICHYWDSKNIERKGKPF